MSASQRLFVLALFCLLPFATASAQGPALSPIVDVTMNADDSASFNIVAVDAQNREITLSASLPIFGALNSPTIGIGEVVTTVTLDPQDIHVGNYTAAVTATAGGVSETEIFMITVNPAGSALPPVVISPALRDVDYDTNLSFTVDIVDPDGTGIDFLDVSGLPSGASFTPDANNSSGAFSWTPDAADAGDYDVVFSATGNNGLSSGAVTHIRVAGPPMLAIAPIDDVSLEGGTSLSVAVSASGLPNALISLTASLPSFATLNPPGSGTGSVNTTITISPPVGSAGTYFASVTAASEGEFVTEPFEIVVTGDGPPQNNPPVLSAPMMRNVNVGENVSFDVTATDIDGDHVDLFGSALPPGANFEDNGDNTGTFSWTPAANQAGTHTASFSGLDGRGGTGTASTMILVAGVVLNRPPTLTAPAMLEVDEGVELTFVVTATDPDGDSVALMADGLPSGANFDDQNDNTGAFSWTPDFTQASQYEVAFTGNDGRGGSGTASTMITVRDVDIPGSCMITGELEFCTGQSTQLCGPDGADTYSWTGPGDFQASTPCIDVDVPGSYELTVVDANGHTDFCSATVVERSCDTVDNCPRGLGFWKQQCAQRHNGSTKFDQAQMDQITACVDASSAFFDWENDFEGFCSVLHPAHPMDSRKQAKRMYAAMLANICTGDLGLVASNGDRIGLDPATEIDCDLEGVNTIADLMDAAETQLAELEGMHLGSDTRAAYNRLKDCIEAVNEGIGIGPTCTDGDDDREPLAAACLIGWFKPWNDETCFRVKPVHESFDPADVDLSSVTLVFGGQSIAAPSELVSLEDACSCGGDCRDRDGHEASYSKTGGDRDHDDDRHDDHDWDRCGVTCDDCDDDYDQDSRHYKGGDRDDDHDRDCDQKEIRACFSTEALLGLFEGAELPCDLRDAEIHFLLSNGDPIVATFAGKSPRHDDEDDEDGEDDGESGDDEDSDDATGSGEDQVVRPSEPLQPEEAESKGLMATATPNPFNPTTELAFTLSREGRVRVSIYDIQGRLVRTLLDETRSAGEQRLRWDGTNSQSQTVSSGVYFVRIQAPEGQATQKLTILK